MKSLIRVLAVCRTHWPALILAALLSMAAAASGIVLMALSGAALLGAASVMALRVAGPGRVVLRYGDRLTGHDATFRALADLRVWFFRRFAARSAGGLGFQSAGDLLSRLVGDVESLNGFLLTILLPISAALLVLCAVPLIVFRLNPLAGAIVFALFAMAAILLPVWAARNTVRMRSGLAAAESGLRVAALDLVSGLREVRAYGAGERMSARIFDAEELLVQRQMEAARRIVFVGAAAALCLQGAALAVAALPGWAGAAHAGLIRAACVFLVLASVDPLGALSRAGAAAGTASLAAQRVLDVADAPPTVAEPEKPAPVPAESRLRFENVHFRWIPDGAEVLSGATLDIPPGAHVALLGASGSGKSTLAALALKVVAPQAGRITLGGTDIAALRTEELRRRIAWLSQSTHIFDDTIAANLRLGLPEATDAELWRALDRAAIGEWVRSLPDQLETWLGEGGARVSGGQARRIALARALLSPAPILILDEPCAGLDADTERAFLSTLYEQAAGRTVLLIAHRLTGAERLDRIWRLSGGHAIAAAA